MRLPLDPAALAIPARLQTARLLLRPFTVTDATALFDAVEEARPTLAPWIHLGDRVPTLAAAQRHCQQLQTDWRQRTALELGLFTPQGRLLGGSGYPYLNWETGLLGIGYWVRPTAVGYGYVNEAVQALTHLAFTALAARRVEIRCDARNERSRHIPERLTFPLEGCLRNEGVDRNGESCDLLVYAMIPADFQQIAPTWPNYAV